MKYILDTSGWYAVVDADDAFHKEATNFIEEQPRFVVPYPVFEELAAIVHHRLGKNVARKGIGKLLDSPLVEVVYLSEVDNHSIWQMYEKSAAHLDFVDCSVIWAAQRSQLPVFTFDKHFQKAGLQKWQLAN